MHIEEHENNSKVTRLFFQRSQIYEIPGEIFQKFPNLKVIKAQNSQIQSVSNLTFEHALELRDFDLTGNRIRVLSDGTFQNLENLNFLILKKNAMSLVEPFAFSGLLKLQTLDLSYNKITELSGLVFSQLQKLEKIILTNNQLEKLEDHLFAFNEELKEIFLDQNNLMSIGIGVFNAPKNLKQLVLSYNNLQNLDLGDFNGDSLDIRENEIERIILSKSVKTFHAEGQKIKFLTLHQHDDLNLRKYFMDFESLQELILFVDSDSLNVNDLEPNPKFLDLVNKLKERKIVKDNFQCSIAKKLEDSNLVKIKCATGDYEEYTYEDSE